MNNKTDEGIGDKFQQETKYFPDKMSGGGLNWESKPEIYKSYPAFKKIRLPEPKPENSVSLNEVIKKRRSIRNFTDEPLTLHQLSYLLWASTGIQRIYKKYKFRTVPSAGALYPIETYVIINNMKDLGQGVYHYSVESHELEIIKSGDFRNLIADAALGQRMCSKASVVFIFTAVFSRSIWKYKQRAYRYIYMDVGHIMQNLTLAVTAENLGGCPVAAIFDDETNKILEIDGIEESAIYLMPIGYI